MRGYSSVASKPKTKCFPRRFECRRIPPPHRKARLGAGLATRLGPPFSYRPSSSRDAPRRTPFDASIRFGSRRALRLPTPKARTCIENPANHRRDHHVRALDLPLSTYERPNVSHTAGQPSHRITEALSREHFSRSADLGLTLVVEICFGVVEGRR